MTMKKRGKIALLILQFGAVLAFAGAFYFVTQRTMEPVTVYQLSQDIPMNSKIGASDFRKVEIPRDAVTKNMITDIDKYIDLHASTRLFASQYATEDMFVSQDEVDPFEVADLSKMRKVTIPASYVDAVGGNLSYGDSIDLVYTSTGETDKGEPYTYSHIFMQDVLVYSVTTSDGFRYQDRTSRIKGDVSSSDQEPLTSTDSGNLAQITLAVTPAQAEEVATRLETGEIKVVGRFNNSTNQAPSGFIIGDYQKVFSGNQLAETNTNLNINTDLNSDTVEVESQQETEVDQTNEEE